uniref:PDZ domain containing 8 n=1 Tax=Sphaeramia orbicularis TaxID=375764 RepID=A0A673BE18_9TELE
MLYLLLLSALSGALLTLLLQFLLLYRRSPEPVGRTVQYGQVVPEDSLKEYFKSEPGPPGPPGPQLPPPPPPPPPPSQPEPPEANRAESCQFLNAIFLFLFRELRDTPLVRHWITKKIKVEFEELLQTRTAGRLLEGLSLREVSLGNSLPVFRSATLMKPVALDEDGMPEELNLELGLAYSGGFHLGIDVDLVFGKSAYLYVKMRRVEGRLRLQFTRVPFSHWSFSFLEDPLVDFEVKSQFEGRPLPQLTSIIVNQLKRVIKKKHTLPNYKIRYKPFFPFQVQPPLGSTDLDLDLCVQDSRLGEGRLRVGLIQCSRLFILGSYDRETSVHCTLELSPQPWKEKSRSSIKQVTGSVLAGVKVTSSVQVPKLLKQAGDRVVVLYERPVRHQNPSLGSLGTLQEGFGQLEEGGFISQPGGYEEDPAPITTLSDSNLLSDSKDLDSEFEELIVDPKPTQTGAPNSATSTAETKEDFLLTVNQSPKRTVATLASKPLGTISPILNRKLNLVGLQSPLKPQPKESPKPSPHKSSSDQGEGPQRPTVPPPPVPSRPPVPPRPQIRLTSASSEISLLENIDSVTTPVSTAGEDKASAEKTCTKPTETKPSTRPADSSDELPVPPSLTGSAKTDQAKDKASESSCSTRDSLDDHSLWESAETTIRNQTARWSKASVVFEVESNHKYLNVALWCKDPFKLGSLLCLGHVSLQLEHIALECMATSSAEYQSTFRLGPPEPRANVSRTALRSLSTHKGFNEKLCYGDVTLNFCYLAEGEVEYPGGLAEREREGSLHEEDLRERDKEHIPSAPRDDLAYGAMQLVEVRHNFQDTQFQNPTWCEYCKKKVWTKAASQCMVCAYVCHKKCQDKCLAENPFCVAATERRGADPEAKSTLNRATTGLTRHIINTSSRLLNLRQVPKTRLAEQTNDTAPGTVEPSPKHTPNTSDNESSDTETYTSGASPSKQPAGSAGSGKLVRKEGGLDDSVFIAVKEIGRDLYRGLPTDERSQKLELMLDKLQQEIDQELEHNNALLLEEREAADARRKALIGAALAKSGERLQALTLLMIHYRAGIEDLESVESTSPSEQPGFKGKGEGLEEEGLLGAEVYDSDTCSPVEVQLLDDITEEQICVEALH